MADISPTSQSELVNRRQQLRRQRRWRTLKTVWQLLAVGGLTGGLLWALSLYDWMLRNPSQIKIQGNQVLSTETIRSLLPIHYPESLLTVHPQSIAHFLETEAPIAEATVVRQLFPPGLTVRIQERYPVAVVYLADPAAATVPEGKGQKAPMALIDEEGAWIPYEVYASLNPTNGLPELKVQGMREDYRSYWPSLYKHLSHSPVKVSEIDWRDPSNLILHTELGAVYLGSYSPRFSKQLKVLDEMRELPEQVSLDEIAYIDLRNPEIPVIEMGTPQVRATTNSDASTDSEP
ncbi:MAG: FtsQ-type POTRA domain-containing protein [Elainellaceae cyanobacterium]